MKKRLTKLMAVLLLLGITGPAHAILLDRGGGLIYDDDLNITWLSDANYAETSGFDADGQMPWATAVSWADGLSFGGYDDWRLPTGDPACGTAINCSGSEMGHLFYDELGGTAGSFILGSGDPDLAFFTNIQNYIVLVWYGGSAPSRRQVELQLRGWGPGRGPQEQRCPCLGGSRWRCSRSRTRTGYNYFVREWIGWIGAVSEAASSVI